MSARACQATTKSGEPCRNPVVLESGYCLPHGPKEVAESRGFGGSQPGAGRPALPKPSDIARRLIEENALALQRPYWLALGYDVVIGDDGLKLVERSDGGAKLYGTSKDGYVQISSHEDLEAMQRAAERLQDRVYGKAKQQTEVTGAEGGPIEFVAIEAGPERAAEVARLLLDQGAAED